ncbi:MAG TPA: sugar ABC transporter permease [Candidatus Scatomorpha intestinigallinarum]|uniref:Sugar ABC transporter permease n=1 Tax=Candidatus Scatomorpha intestinigallinarum TaxID=2840923 RepID=A0A9D1J099_9FIRM|nr:sugar ABC transporter permease [Candidatus Scatomorpha intestinigallinarum]
MSNSASNLPARRKKFSARDIFATFGVYALLIFMALLVLTPIVWIIGASFNPMSSLLSATAFPENPTVLHYVKLIKETKFVYWYANTLKIALINMAISVVLTSMTSYVFSRFRFKGKRAGLLSILILQMFPSFMGMMATYNILWQLNLLDTHFGLILTYAAGQVPYNTWLVKGYLANIPRSLDEAAKLDGASNLRIFTQIVLPLMKPILIFVALSQFITPWMDFIFPRMILSSPEKKTLAIGLYDMINANTNNNFTTFAAGAILVAVPITILYVCLQKYLIQGVTAGANKS